MKNEKSKMSWVWINDRIVPEEEATVSVFDRGFLHGHSVFETMRAYGGVVFRVEDHLERLARSARLVCIDIPLPPDRLAAAMARVLEANGLTDAAVRLTVSAGSGIPNGPKPVVVCSARPLPCYARPDLLRNRGPDSARGRDEQQEGVDVILARVVRVPPEAFPVEAKSGNYLNCLLARREAEACGAFEALMTDGTGQILEGSFTNLFVLVVGRPPAGRRIRRGTGPRPTSRLDRRLITPPADGRILPGITRAVVMELVPSIDPNLGPIEAPLRVNGIGDWTEAFLTGSLCEVVPIRRIGGRDMGASGPVTRQVQTAYRRCVAEYARGRSSSPPTL